MEIGIKELRDNLSRELAAVRTGKTITVTDHGRPIARIIPIGTPTRLEQLIAEGSITPAARRKGPAPVPVRGGGPVSDLISEQRR